MAVDELTVTPYAGPQSARTVRLTVVQAVHRNLGITLAPIALLVLIAAAIGLLRSPTYTGEARLNVGGVSLTTESIPGYTVAVQELATAYSRAIDAPAVVNPVARRVNSTPATVASRLSATPVQNSPVIRVDATGSSPAEVIALANAGSDSLVSYALRLNSGKAAGNELLRRFVTASRELQAATVALAQTPPNSAARAAAQTKVDVARLQMQTAGGLYQQSQVGQSTTDLVEELAPAVTATSDRSSVLQDLVAGALIAGALIGVGLAIARANGLSMRRLGEG